MKKESDLFDRPENRKKIRMFFYLALAATVVSDFFVARKYVHFPWDNIPGFYAFFGFTACVLIIILAKAIGHAWLMKHENYYE